MYGKKGWYSAKYDSTKQSEVMGKKNGMLKYKTSIRFEMLLAERIVITDAQWYDGLFFAEMTAQNNGEEFNEFIKFLLEGVNCGDKNLLPLTIRRRDKYPTMFRNSFWFSSIQNPNLQEFIFHIWDENEDNKTEVLKTLDSYLNYLEDKLNEKQELELIKDFEKFKIRIKTLDSVDERLFIPWGTEKYMSDYIKEAKPRLEEILSKLNLEYIEKQVNIIEEEINKASPSRSKINDSINEIKRIKKQDTLCEQFMHEFDNSYNCAIALQHECEYYDLYDAILSKKYNEGSVKSFDLNSYEFPAPVLEYLGVMTWEEFGKVYYDENIMEKRKQWLSDFDSGVVETTRRSFSEYVNCIIRKANEIGIWLTNESVFYKASGTLRFIDGQDMGKMVGGAASDNFIESNEICFYLGGKLSDKQKNQIIRYGSTEEVDKWFDTVFAPIESIMIEK